MFTGKNPPTEGEKHYSPSLGRQSTYAHDGSNDLILIILILGCILGCIIIPKKPLEITF
jgi:hypothetical protein